MPQNPSSASLLLTAAAVLAVTASGCVSVQAPDGRGRHAPSATAPAPRPDGHAGRPLVQAPVREALERTGRAPHHTPAAPRTGAAHTEAPRTGTPHTQAPPVRRPPRHTAPAPAPKPPPRGAAPGPAVRPAAPEPPARTDVCALGHAYGHWAPDSPQAVICRDAYGS
ncbi:hypothetical protein [Streptomyces sp. NPDC016845]|uniref:hypothetical protein n=1 Tax=Streptomyces sp. NPDC016845 TaxID=3364972 RepID=UPI0037927A4F